MDIHYAAKQIWRKPTAINPEIFYSKKNTKRIRSTLSRLAEYQVSYTFVPLSEEFLHWFSPLYIELIGQKRNATLHNLHEKTLGNPTPPLEYMALTVTMGDTVLGGAIVSINGDRLMIAYRAFLPKWPTGSLQASPSLYADYVIAKIAHTLGKQQISHGKDRNLFGINSDIGQLIYKLSVGYRPQLPAQSSNEPHEVLTINTDEITENTVILHYPEVGELITNATLVTKRQDEELYSQLFHYSEQLAVTILYRD